MRVAIIDLGTNTFNLLIAEVYSGTFKLIHKEKQAVKLGKHGINSGRIAEDAFKRGVKAMRHYKKVISLFATQKTVATATSAMRDSANAAEFISQVKEETGIEINVISGLEEAKLIQIGVEKAIPKEISTYTIMDVGGGSTEFILVKNHEVVWAKSYNLGVSRLLDWLNPTDPISKINIEKLKNRLDTELAEVYEEIENLNSKLLIGSSGSFDSVHDMLAAKSIGEKESHELIYSQIDLEKMYTLHLDLVNSTLNERLNWPGLIEMRADMMVVSSILMNHVLQKCGIQKLFRSEYALKEGLLFSLAT